MGIKRRSTCARCGKRFLAIGRVSADFSKLDQPEGTRVPGIYTGMGEQYLCRKCEDKWLRDVLPPKNFRDQAVKQDYIRASRYWFLREVKRKGKKDVPGQLSIPMIAGGVYRRQRFVRCGKKSCWCAGVDLNRDGHGPYWYIEFRDNSGKKYTRYIGAEWDEAKAKAKLRGFAV